MESWPPERGKTGHWILGCLSPVSFVIVLFVLLTMASYDVVGIWVVFYIVMGYAQLRGGAHMLECLDLSWPFDTIYPGNKAVAFPTVGGFVDVTLIYAGTGTGDDPGWWVVLFAAGLGLVAWLRLALLTNVSVHISERVSVDRDMGSGIRFGAYLTASSMILAYAFGGDWTSVQATLLEFTIGWPVLPLVLFFLLVEWFYIQLSHSLVDGGPRVDLLPSVPLGCVYLPYASIVLLFFHRISERVSDRMLL